MGMFNSQQESSASSSSTLNGGITFGRGTPAGNSTMQTGIVVAAVALVLVALIWRGKARGGGK